MRMQAAHRGKVARQQAAGRRGSAASGAEGAAAAAGAAEAATVATLTGWSDEIARAAVLLGVKVRFLTPKPDPNPSPNQVPTSSLDAAAHAPLG